MEFINDMTNENVTFWKAPRRTKASKECLFDVRVSLSTSKGQGVRLTIAFGTNVMNIIDPYTRAKVSSFDMVPDKIYLGFYADNHANGTYQISRAKDSKNKNPKIQYTIYDTEITTFKKYWKDGGYYKLRFDEALRLYYIPNSANESEA